jgi:hypothetical protein
LKERKDENMKKKHRLILLFMLVFAGVILLSYMPAQAVGVDPCSSTEEPYCFAITDTTTDGLSVQIWVMRAVDADGDTYLDGVNFIWPYTDALGRAVFGYEIGTTEAAEIAVKEKRLSKPSAGSYIYFKVSAPPIESYPPGASIDINNIPTYCNESTLGALYAWKVNARWNFGKVATIELFYPAGTSTDLDCVECGVIWSNECQVLDIAGARAGEVFRPAEPFYCSDTDTNVVITYNPCTLDISSVTCDGYDADGPTYDNYLYVEVPDPDNPTRTIRIPNMGPEAVVLCTDGGPVVSLGDRAWWCGTAPP